MCPQLEGGRRSGGKGEEEQEEEREEATGEEEEGAREEGEGGGRGEERGRARWKRPSWLSEGCTCGRVCCDCRLHPSGAEGPPPRVRGSRLPSWRPLQRGGGGESRASQRSRRVASRACSRSGSQQQRWQREVPLCRLVSARPHGATPARSEVRGRAQGLEGPRAGGRVRGLADSVTCSPVQWRPGSERDAEKWAPTPGSRRPDI